MQNATRLFCGLGAAAIIGGLLALGVFSAKDKFVAWQAERTQQRQDIQTAEQKCNELSGEVVKYIEANKEDEKLKENDAVEALQFIVNDEMDPWGHKYVLAIEEGKVIVSSSGPSDSAEDDVRVSRNVAMPKKGIWDRVKGLFK